MSMSAAPRLGAIFTIAGAVVATAVLALFAYNLAQPVRSDPKRKGSKSPKPKPRRVSSSASSSAANSPRQPSRTSTLAHPTQSRSVHAPSPVTSRLVDLDSPGSANPSVTPNINQEIVDESAASGSRTPGSPASSSGTTVRDESPRSPDVPEQHHPVEPATKSVSWSDVTFSASSGVKPRDFIEGDENGTTAMLAAVGPVSTPVTVSKPVEKTTGSSPPTVTELGGSTSEPKLRTKSSESPVTQSAAAPLRSWASVAKSVPSGHTSEHPGFVVAAEDKKEAEQCTLPTDVSVILETMEFNYYPFSPAPFRFDPSSLPTLAYSSTMTSRAAVDVIEKVETVANVNNAVEKVSHVDVAKVVLSSVEKVEVAPVDAIKVAKVAEVVKTEVDLTAELLACEEYGSYNHQYIREEFYGFPAECTLAYIVVPRAEPVAVVEKPKEAAPAYCVKTELSVVASVETVQEPTVAAPVEKVEETTISTPAAEEVQPKELTTPTVEIKSVRPMDSGIDLRNDLPKPSTPTASFTTTDSFSWADDVDESHHPVQPATPVTPAPAAPIDEDDGFEVVHTSRRKPTKKSSVASLGSSSPASESKRATSAAPSSPLNMKRSTQSLKTEEPAAEKSQTQTRHVDVKPVLQALGTKRSWATLPAVKAAPIGGSEEKGPVLGSSSVWAKKKSEKFEEAKKEVEVAKVEAEVAEKAVEVAVENVQVEETKEDVGAGKAIETVEAAPVAQVEPETSEEPSASTEPLPREETQPGASDSTIEQTINLDSATSPQEASSDSAAEISEQDSTGQMLSQLHDHEISDYIEEVVEPLPTSTDAVFDYNAAPYSEAYNAFYGTAEPQYYIDELGNTIMYDPSQYNPYAAYDPSAYTMYDSYDPAVAAVYGGGYATESGYPAELHADAPEFVPGSSESKRDSWNINAAEFVPTFGPSEDTTPQRHNRRSFANGTASSTHHYLGNHPHKRIDTDDTPASAIHPRRRETTDRKHSYRNSWAAPQPNAPTLFDFVPKSALRSSTSSSSLKKAVSARRESVGGGEVWRGLGGGEIDWASASPATSSKDGELGRSLSTKKSRGEMKKGRCLYGQRCTNKERCLYRHPTDVCRYYPDCKFGDNCMYVHPTTEASSGPEASSP
ncbi:hypothetical protein BJ742DRAFT_811811 [Cladochytrium replicatum]|nr:hypothetical protein BJ742DRAFT_811811 [Cladochytrium replicatum]